MKKIVLPVMLAAGALMASVPAAQAASKQYVVVVTEGASPQILDLGKGYLRKADEDAELATSFDSIAEGGKAAPVNGSIINDLNGLLDTAEKNGYKTGLITTADVTKVAPLFYGSLDAAWKEGDFIAGGGRANTAAAGAAFKAAGGTYIENADGLAEEIKGRVLAVEADGNLSYAIDRKPEDESGLAELATLALDTLGDNDTPFVLVIHDTLVKKAIETKDSPALFEQFRELNSILGDTLARQEDNAQLGVISVLTGGAPTPQFAAGANPDTAYFTLSSLTKSFAGVGEALKGADVESITAFADPTEGEYRGWKLTATQKDQISKGTLNAETVARGSYEPVLKLEFNGAAGAPSATAIGIDASAGVAPALKKAVSTPAK